MGGCASANVNRINVTSSEVPGDSESALKESTCEIHGSTLRYFNPLKEEIYCATCFQDYKRKHTRAESAHVQKIDDYLNSIDCKQIESQTLKRLGNTRYNVEHLSFRVAQILKKVKLKRTKILDEIKLYVATLIELLQHLEKELYADTDTKLLGVENDLNEYQVSLQGELDQLIRFKGEIENHQKSKNNTAKLNSVIKCKTFLRKHSANNHRLKDYDPSLRLNKDISCNDIIGRGRGTKGKDTKNVSLGTITLEVSDINDGCDALSDISEEPSDNSVYTQKSTTQQTTSTSSTLPSNVYSTDRTPTPSRGSVLNGNTGRSSVIRQHRQQPNTKGLDTELENGDELINNNEHIEKLDNETNDLEANGRLSNVDGVTYDQSQHRMQFQRDSILTRNVSRRVSYSGTPSRKTPTPRRSSQSIVSPGNITTPFFISPRHVSNKEGMEGRMPVEVKIISLPRDEKVANVTDTTQLPDGKIVLCDEKNNKLILLSRQLEIISQLKLTGSPHNITSVPGSHSRIAVTLPEDNVIRVVNIANGEFDETMEVLHLKSKPKCRGIDFMNDHLIYTSRNDVVVLQSHDHDTLWKFKYAFRNPVSLTADRRKGDLFVSCYGQKSYGEVVKMHFQGEKIDFVVSCAEIRHPVCSTIDREGNIYICDVDPPSVHQVCPDGTYCRRILSDNKLQHVNFIEGTDMFIMTKNDSDNVHIYEMR